VRFTFSLDCSDLEILGGEQERVTEVEEDMVQDRASDQAVSMRKHLSKLEKNTKQTLWK
jgi:hypothetical protein